MTQTLNLITQANCLVAQSNTTTTTTTQIVIGLTIGLVISAVIFGVGYWLANK